MHEHAGVSNAGMGRQDISGAGSTNLPRSSMQGVSASCGLGGAGSGRATSVGGIAACMWTANSTKTSTRMDTGLAVVGGFAERFCSDAGQDVILLALRGTC